MVDILQKIVANKRREVAEALQLVSREKLVRQIENTKLNQVRVSLVDALNSTPGIIAEFKRASPSKGIINATSSVEDIVYGYDVNGAIGISVLTDKDYFGATPTDFSIARSNTRKPLLRKEFIIDEYQIYESKCMGANVVLLIAAILSKQEINSFTKTAHNIGLEVLIELHDESEIDKLSGNEDIIGVNNRNLKTFEVDIKKSIYIKNKLGTEINSTPLISESGLSSTNEIYILLNEGFKGFLIGEYFMNQEDPITAFSNLNKAVRALS